MESHIYLWIKGYAPVEWCKQKSFVLLEPMFDAVSFTNTSEFFVVLYVDPDYRVCHLIVSIFV